MVKKSFILHIPFKKIAPSRGLSMAEDQIIENDGMIVVHRKVFTHIGADVSGPADNKYVFHVFELQIRTVEKTRQQRQIGNHMGNQSDNEGVGIGNPDQRKEVHIQSLSHAISI